jgi:enterochelin esterase-like enzyme
MDSYPSDIAGANLPVRIYQPPCFGEDGRVYPALYLFHGSDQTDSHWDDLGIDESAEELIRTGVIPALLIIMPGGGWIANNTSGGPLSFEQVVVDELLPYVEENYCAWSQRSGRAIGGLSRGGYWALEIAFRHSEAFSSVGGHSAALLDSAAGPDLNPQYTALSNPLGDLRIYLDIGQQDWVIGNIKQLHEDLASRSIPHVWQLNDGAHEDAYWAAHTGEYLTWYASPWPLDRNQYLPCLY